MQTRRNFSVSILATALGLFVQDSADAKNRVRRNRALCGSPWRRNSQVPTVSGERRYCFKRRDANLGSYTYTDIRGVTHTMFYLFVPTCENGVTIPLGNGDTLVQKGSRYCITLGLTAL